MKEIEWRKGEIIHDIVRVLSLYNQLYVHQSHNFAKNLTAGMCIMQNCRSAMVEVAETKRACGACVAHA